MFCCDRRDPPYSTLTRLTLDLLPHVDGDVDEAMAAAQRLLEAESAAAEKAKQLEDHVRVLERRVSELKGVLGPNPRRLYAEVMKLTSPETRIREMLARDERVKWGTAQVDRDRVARMVSGAVSDWLRETLAAAWDQVLAAVETPAVAEQAPKS